MNLPCVTLLLSQGANVNIQAGDLGNALQAAITGRSLDVVKLLLRNGADINAVDAKGDTPLNFAIIYRSPHLDLIEALMNAGADPFIEKHDCYVPMVTAASMGHTAIVTFLLDHGADPNRSASLQAALFSSHIDIAEMLLDKGASLERNDWSLGSPIAAAADSGLLALRFLVEARYAECHWTDNQGRTVLHHASQEGTVETVSELLYLGLRINQEDARGWTAIHYAALAETPEKLKLLLSKTQPPQAELNNWSPLHLACRRNMPEALDLLVEAGYYPTTVTTSQPPWEWTLYDIAVFYENRHLVSPMSELLHPLLMENVETDHGHGYSRIQNLEFARRSSHWVCDGCDIKLETPMPQPVFVCGECTSFDYCFMCMLTADKTHPHSSWTKRPYEGRPVFPSHTVNYAYVDLGSLERR